MGRRSRAHSQQRVLQTSQSVDVVFRPKIQIGHSLSRDLSVSPLWFNVSVRVSSFTLLITDTTPTSKLPTDGVQTDRRTDGQMDRQTDRQTDRRTDRLPTGRQAHQTDRQTIDTTQSKDIDDHPKNEISQLRSPVQHQETLLD
jgi:hypothetical protein